ncbi:MAG: hypothetical protein ACYC19_03465 [Acidimicrobiales bacterium]
MSNVTSSANDVVRRGLLKISEDAVLTTVDSLNLKGNRLQAVVGMPLRTLQQRRDVVSFASTAPMAAVKGLLELLALNPLEKVIETLGEHADSPSYEQLSAALDALVANGMSADEVVAVLTFAIGEAFPAAAHCRRLLEERDEWSLPELPQGVSAPSLLTPKEVDAEVREQRRRRREQEKAKKKATPTRPVKPSKPKVVHKDGPRAPISARTPDVASEVALEFAERRHIVLTPGELAHFSPDHPLVGTVVLVDIPYSAIDPEAPEQKSKQRPAVVVGASDDGVLVQGVYTNPSSTRVLFQPWRRLGLDHVCYVEGVRVAISVGLDSLERLGKLANDEWNSLI